MATIGTGMMLILKTLQTGFARPAPAAALVAALLATCSAAFAESVAHKRGVPSSLPPVLTSNSVNSTASTTVIPYATDPRDSLASLTASPVDSAFKNAPNACRADSVVCYDYRKRHSVVPITKTLMPDVPGLKKEGLAIRRDRVAFNYSF